MKKMTALLLAVLMVFTLAACKKNLGGADSVVGTYVLVEAIENGENVSLEGVSMSIVLNEDNTVTYGAGDAQSGTLMNITWSQEGNTVTLVSEQIGPDDPLVMTLDGKTLTATTGGLTMVFEKQ